MQKIVLLTICIFVTFTSCFKNERATNKVPACTAEIITTHTPLTQEQCIQALTHAIVADDRETVAKLVEYPFQQPYPLKNIHSQEEFIAYYDQIISPVMREDLQNSTLLDWHQKSWRGVYFKNGVIWIRDKSLMEEDTITVSEGYKLYAVNYSNVQKDKELARLQQVERNILGITRTDVAPQLCYLSKDSTILVFFIGNHPTDTNAYINIYQRSHAFVPVISNIMIAEIEDDNQCLNTFYTAFKDGYTLTLHDADCCGRLISESSYMLSLSKTSNQTKIANHFLDSLYLQYKTHYDSDIYMTPVYLHEIAKWW